MQGAAYHEISTEQNRLHDGIHKISHETNCLLVPLRLINVNVAPALETTAGMGSKATKWCIGIIFLLAAYFFKLKSGFLKEANLNSNKHGGVFKI